jgi:hypothetical protein
MQTLDVRTVSMRGLAIRMLWAELAFTMGLLYIAPSQATTIIVPSSSFPAIQDGIDQAIAGDTVLVLSGTYRGARNVELSFDGKDIALLGEDRDGVVIDGEGQSQLLKIEKGESIDARVERITFANSVDSGIRIKDSALTVVDTRITGCSGSSGGGLRVLRSTVYLERCVLDENVAERSGGAFSAVSSSIVLVDSEILGNAVLESLCQGGGGHCYLSDVLIENCVIGGNHGAFGYGGGLQLLVCDSIIRSSTIAGNRMITNNPNAGGGGISIDGGAAVIERTAFYDNCTHPLSGQDLLCLNSNVEVMCSYAQGIVGDVQTTGPMVTGDIDLCLPVSCEDAPTADGSYDVGHASVLLPENNACGVLVGALEGGCGVSEVPVGPRANSLTMVLKPNPARELARATFTLAQPAHVTVTVQSVDGRQIGEFRQRLESGEQTVALGPLVDDLPDGVYFVSVRAADQLGKGRLVLVR